MSLPGRRGERMRVLHLTTEFPPVIYGGLGTAVGGWVRASARAGISVGVLLVEGELAVGAASWAARYGAPAPGRGRQARSEGIVDPEGVTFFQARWPDAPLAGARLAGAWKPDVIHLHTAMVWPVAEAIRRSSTTPLVFHVHSVDRAEYEIGAEPHPWLVHSEQETAIASADRLIALCRDERDLLAHYYPAVRPRIRVVGNGIDDSAGAAASATRCRAGSGLLILYSGRLVERKGIRDLLAVIPRVLAEAPESRFVFAGGPPHQSGAQVASQWLGTELEPHLSRIHFTGWLSAEELSAWYRAADILVVPSRYEPFGMVILEGMLHGLAVVASNVGGPVEILEDGRTGLLFEPRDVDGLARALLLLISDADLRQHIAQAAAHDVRQRWSWPARVARMQAVYEEVAPGPRRTVRERTGQ